MTLDEFRITHSLLIEHYQHIEYNMKGILAAISDGSSFLEGMEDVERDSIKRLVRGIKLKQEEHGETILEEDECDWLIRISESRNYWCHQCYIAMTFDFRTGAPKKDYEINRLLQDVTEAKQMRDLLFEKKLPLVQEKVRSELINGRSSFV